MISCITLVIGIIALLRTHLFSRARLHIEHNQREEYQPEITYIDQTGQIINSQKYLRVKIRNTGFAIAA